jgi:hypothetical protein
MDLLSSIKLPYWLMIAGAISIAMGSLGLVFTRSKQAATNPDSEPPIPRPQMPPLPRLLDSSRHEGQRMTVHGHPPAWRAGAESEGETERDWLLGH